MFKKIRIAAFLLFAQLFPCQVAHAGLDLWGYVQRVQIAPDGKIWFMVDSPEAPTYCKADWFGLNLYIPPDNPQYAYYYGLLMSAVTKQKMIVVANISVFNGTTACDITKTNYGLVILK